MKRRITFWAVTAVFLGASATLWAQSRQEQQMAAELRMLQEQQQQIALAVSQLGETLTEAIKALHPRFDAQNEAMRKGLANLELTIKTMANDLSAIRAQTQDTGTRIGSLTDEVEAVRKTLESLPGMIAQLIPSAPVVPVDPSSSSAVPGAPAPGVVAPAPVAIAPPPVQVSSAASLSPTRLLATAQGDYYAAQYGSAVTGFEAVIRIFPTSQAAAEAQFLIGESYYAENKSTEAIAAYNLVIQNHPTSTFLPQAYYKRGLSQDRTGQLDAARGSFEFAVKTYADTDYGRLARQALDRINRQTPQTKP